MRVVGGWDALPGQFPWQAWLEGYSYGSFFSPIGCGGVLVTQQHLLTAAHCVRGIILFKVSLGQVNKPPLPNEGLEFMIPGYRAIPHPQYNKATNENDIAIVTLLYRVYPTGLIHPIKLPEPWEGSETLNGREAVVSGFGKIRDDEQTSHPVLQYTRLQILQKERCKEFFKINFNTQIRRSQICTTFFENISGVCSGDSGGPLVVNNSYGIPTLVGIVSIGVSPCEAGLPSVYTDVSFFIPWINEITQAGVR